MKYYLPLLIILILPILGAAEPLSSDTLVINPNSMEHISYNVLQTQEMKISGSTDGILDLVVLLDNNYSIWQEEGKFNASLDTSLNVGEYSYEFTFMQNVTVHILFVNLSNSTVICDFLMEILSIDHAFVHGDAYFVIPAMIIAVLIRKKYS